MTATEKRAMTSLSLIYAFRMFGLFMIFPVFAIYAKDLPGATPQTIGLAMGIYGLTQAIFQIPFGMLSDRFGRKPIITTGLVLFALGSVIAALSSDIWWIIIGRAVQGSGAIAAAIMALASDLTSEKNRTKIMASIGVSIGIAFSLSLVLGPVFINWFSLSGLFWITALVSVIGIAILLLWVPNPVDQVAGQKELPIMEQIKAILTHKQLIKLDMSVFILHMTLTSIFLVLPAMMVQAGLVKQDHWMLYLPVLLLSFVFMVPFVIVAEKKKQIKSVLLLSIAILLLSLLSLGFYHRTLASIAIALFLFFVAFNVMEATLPSLLSKIAPQDYKGGAMGVFSTSQFMGVFVGGAFSGWLTTHSSMPMLFVCLSFICVVWAIVVRFLVVAQG